MEDGRRAPAGPASGLVMATTRTGGLRLHVRGRLGPVEAERLQAVLEDVVDSPGTAVRVELSRAGALPVGVLRALATASRRLTAAGGLLRVEHPSPAAAVSLRTSGLHRVLRIDGWPAARPPLADAAEA